MKNIILIVTIFLSIYSIKAQKQKFAHYSNWNTINISKDFNTNWSTNIQLNLRRANFLSNWEQIIIRPFLYYRLEKDLDIALGYSFIRNYHHSNFSTPLDVTENNIF